jgi:hypothetical protein
VCGEYIDVPDLTSERYERQLVELIVYLKSKKVSSIAGRHWSIAWSERSRGGSRSVPRPSPEK